MGFPDLINPKQTIVIALGDPAGIGMEVVLKALGSSALPDSIEPILVGCRSSLEAVHQRLRHTTSVPLADPGQLTIDDQPLQSAVPSGAPSAAGGAAGFRWLTRAVTLLQHRHARALVTAPIAKHLWHAAGHRYPGQTERLAELAGSPRSSMLFTAVSPYTAWRLNTLLATTHIPLGAVAQALTPELVSHKLNVLLEFCRRFNPHPHLVVSGLNPHAGRGRTIGF
jgi:4-hydroxythreonine-4-phosphate dehydrogenase